MFKILIVDDHPIFCMGLKELLAQETDFTVCGTAGDIATARKAVKDYRPDMVIVDISLGQDNGLDLVKELSESEQSVFILVLSLHDEAVWAERALHAGTRGYVMKKEASESVVKAIRSIRQGKLYISEHIMSHILERFCGNVRCNSLATMDLLTDRELEVFRLIGVGFSSKEIADKLHVSIKTVGTYRDRIKQKLCLKSGLELTRKAVLWSEREQTPLIDEA